MLSTKEPYDAEWNISTPEASSSNSPFPSRQLLGKCIYRFYNMGLTGGFAPQDHWENETQLLHWATNKCTNKIVAIINTVIVMVHTVLGSGQPDSICKGTLRGQVPPKQSLSSKNDSGPMSIRHHLSLSCLPSSEGFATTALRLFSLKHLLPIFLAWVN